jgi:dTDP-4-dehydrorhamnose reductase
MDITPLKVDITNEMNLMKILQKNQPDLIIHSAAIRDLEFCEINIVHAKKVNIQATTSIINFCNNTNSKLYFISTDMVFPGSEKKFSESSIMKPLNYYGNTKVQAETLIESNLEPDNWLIARISRLYGPHPLNRRKDFIETIIGINEKNKEINLLIDEYRNITYTPWAAKVIIQLIERNHIGRFHICGNENISKFEWGKLIVDKFDLNEKIIKSINYSDLIKEYQQQISEQKNKNSETHIYNPLIRPKKLILDNSKLLSTIGAKSLMPSISETLKEIKGLINDD